MDSQVQSAPPQCIPMASFSNEAPWMVAGCTGTVAD